MSEESIIFEFIAMGQQVKVSAIDTKTGIEVSLITPISLSREQMMQQASAKLAYRLQKKTN